VGNNNQDDSYVIGAIPLFLHTGYANQLALSIIDVKMGRLESGTLGLTIVPVHRPVFPNTLMGWLFEDVELPGLMASSKQQDKLIVKNKYSSVYVVSFIMQKG
jgi:hypothetical protein